MRLQGIHSAKKHATTIGDLLSSDSVRAKFKERKDKLSGEPIWREAWHHFMDLKKGQSFRCNIVRTKRIKDPVTGKQIWKTEWERHQKRFMSIKMSQFREQVLKWEPYIRWRRQYLAKNPKIPRDWQVGEKRLYKERCFCIDKEEAVRKCGCEYHLKMQEYIAALKRWRRNMKKNIRKHNPGHICLVCNLLHVLIY